MNHDFQRFSHFGTKLSGLKVYSYVEVINSMLIFVFSSADNAYRALNFVWILNLKSIFKDNLYDLSILG